jgi:Tol biopolymer transport system component
MDITKPDGRIVYAALSSEPTHELWIMNPDGTERKQLTFDSANDISPAESNDGRYIAFASNRTGSFEIWRMNPDGSNVARSTHTAWANPPSISPDSKWVIYLSSGSLYRVPIEGGGGAANIWRQPLDGSPPKRITDFNTDGIFRFDVSPDGKNLVCSRGGWRHDVALIKNLR